MHQQADEEREAAFQFDGLQRGLAPYFDWKRGLNDDYGLSLGVYVYALYRQANSSLAGSDDDAFGNIFRFMGSWTVFQKDNGNLGRIEYRVESRSNIGRFQAPGSLGSAVGIASLAPGFGYSENFDLDLAVFAVGRLGFDAYLDAFPFQSTSRGLLNRSFVLNPTMATTGIGAIGGVIKGFVSDKFWVGAQMYDANAASRDFDFDTVQEGEWLKAVSSAWRLNDLIFPFVRFGHSDGGAGVAADDAISGGVEITQSFDQVWTVGAGWARPSRETFGMATIPTTITGLLPTDC